MNLITVALRHEAAAVIRCHIALQQANKRVKQGMLGNAAAERAALADALHVYRRNRDALKAQGLNLLMPL